MPEADSSDDSLRLSNMVADALGLRGAVEVITPILEGAGCYRRRDEAVRREIPEFGPDWKMKLVLPNIVETDSYQITSLRSEEHTSELHSLMSIPYPVFCWNK